MVDPGGIHQQGFRHGRPAVCRSGQQHVTQHFRARRAARFTGNDHLETLVLQMCLQALDERGFACALAAFQ